MPNNNDTPNTPAPQRPTIPLATRIISLGCGALVAGILAFVAHQAGNTSVAKGIVQGASAVIILAAVLWALGRRGGTLSRITSGDADERENRILAAAGNDSAFVMLIAGVTGVIGGLYGWSGITVGGMILWAGLLTLVASFFIRLRRG